ncbi:elongation factor P hydroxylase [Colwelliaceae bacterium BS250]
MLHNYQDLITIFAQRFAQTENTQLVKGDGEPIYLPADNSIDFHRIIFAHGFYASALHEISHWCIAGKERRLLEDFGYWYAPDGRDEIQQAKFEQVEIKPQALEWAFCIASGFKFNVSADNLNGAPVNRFAFQYKVHQQVLTYLQQGFPNRAGQFINALLALYHPGKVLTASDFVLPEDEQCDGSSTNVLNFSDSATDNLITA